MNRTKRLDVIEFSIRMARNFPDVPASHLAEMCDSLMRLARRADTYNVKACNVGLTTEEQEKSESIDRKAIASGAILGTTMKTNGDPRGYPFKIIMPLGDYNTWGGQSEGYGIPLA